MRPNLRTFPQAVVNDYVESDGTHCPKCKSQNIEVTDRENAPTSIGVTCDDCGEYWVDVYKLVGINDQIVEPSLIDLLESAFKVAGNMAPRSNKEQKVFIAIERLCDQVRKL